MALSVTLVTDVVVVISALSLAGVAPVNKAAADGAGMGNPAKVVVKELVAGLTFVEVILTVKSLLKNKSLV